MNNQKLRFGQLSPFFIALVVFTIFTSSCSKVEITNLTVTKENHDFIKVHYNFKKGSSVVFPTEEKIEILVPSERKSYPISKPISTLNNKVLLPDKEVGSNIQMYVKVCGKFEKETWVCDSFPIRSSKKYLEAVSQVDFSNLNYPKIQITPLLYREKYGSGGIGKTQRESILPKNTVNGIFKVYINNSTSAISLYGSENGSSLTFDDSDITHLKEEMKTRYLYDNSLQITYNSFLTWNNLTYSIPLKRQDISRPDLIHMGDDYYHKTTLDPLEANYYSFYNFGTKLGVVTFKEFSGIPYLMVEVYSDSEFTNLIASSEESNVLFDKFSNQYLYVKVLNTGTIYSGEYKLNTHMVDYQAIEARALGNRALAELLAWITDTDANTVSRFMDIFNSIVNDESLDQATKRFLYGEFKRQLSLAAGGNFLTDVSTDALPDIGLEIYKYY